MQKNINKLMLYVSVMSVGFMFSASSLHADFSRNAEDIDSLFKSGNSFEASVTAVFPERSFYNATAVDRTGAAVTTGNTAADPLTDQQIPQLTAKFEINPAIDCMLAYRQPYGFDTTHDNDWAGRYKSTRSTADTEAYRAACSYKIPLKGGQFRVIGGAGVMTGSAKLTNTVANAAVSGLPAVAGDAYNVFDFNDSDTQKTWQAGFAYEVPEKAIRASLIYNAKTDLKLHGAQTLTNPLAGTLLTRDIEGTLTWPESVEFKLQSGIKPDWLATGSVKWSNWSGFYELPILDKATGEAFTIVTPGFRDGLSISAGVGHQVSSTLGVQAQVKWGKGVSTGFNSVADTWTASLGGSYQINKQLALKGGVGVVFAESGSAVTTAPVLRYDFGDDVFYAVTTGLEVSF